jgi:hypothetical protein
VVSDCRDNVFIFNTSPDAMCVFDRDGQFIRSWGTEFKDGAHGLFLSKEQKGRVPLPYRQHVGFITDELRRPCCFFQLGQEMYIPNLDARVTFLDRNDRLITHVGDNPDAPRTKGWPNIQDQLQPGKFNSTHACCVDSHGDLYVVEWISTGRVTKLRRQN